jgi:hypothetical protein
MRLFLGLDIGKLTDHAAFAIAERRGQKIAIRYLHRQPLAAAHAATIEHARLLLASDMLDGVTLTVDATGKGEPVLEALRNAGIQQRIIGITLTSGRAIKQTGRNDFCVPKNHIVAALAKTAIDGNLQIPRDLPGAAELCEELHNMKVRLTKSGRIRTGADQYGQHDDLAIAAALAVWTALTLPGTTPEAS